MTVDPYLEDRQLAAPKEIVNLVERFESNLESYKFGHLQRNPGKREFVGRVLMVAGWFNPSLVPNRRSIK